MLAKRTLDKHSFFQRCHAPDESSGHCAGALWRRWCATAVLPHVRARCEGHLRRKKRKCESSREPDGRRRQAEARLREQGGPRTTLAPHFAHTSSPANSPHLRPRFYECRAKNCKR